MGMQVGAPVSVEDASSWEPVPAVTEVTAGIGRKNGRGSEEPKRRDVGEA